MCSKLQQITIKTDSKATIHILETPVKNTKQLIRSKYQTERQYISTQIQKKKLKVTFQKVKAHSGNTNNDLADEEAKKGTESHIKYNTPIISPTLTNDQEQPITDDPRHWLKLYHRNQHLLQWQQNHLGKYTDQATIASTDWVATQMAWEEDGKITNGTNTFQGTHTRTFKTKILHHRLPTASRKKLYDPDYPSDTCIHCNQIETTEHILTCNFTTTKLSIILTNISQQLEEPLDIATISNDLLQCNKYQGHLIKGLIPVSWTTNTNHHQTDSTTIRKKAANLINTIIEQFRKLIWNPWCKMRKQWERDHQYQINRQVHNSQTLPPNTISQPTPVITATLPIIDIKSALQQIMNAFVRPPVMTSSLLYHFNHSTASI
jgi:hypothetical protein